VSEPGTASWGGQWGHMCCVPQDLPCAWCMHGPREWHEYPCSTCHDPLIPNSAWSGFHLRALECLASGSCSGGRICTTGGSDSTEFGRWGHVCCAAGSVCT